VAFGFAAGGNIPRPGRGQTCVVRAKSGLHRVHGQLSTSTAPVPSARGRVRPPPCRGRARNSPEWSAKSVLRYRPPQALVCCGFGWS